MLEPVNITGWRYGWTYDQDIDDSWMTDEERAKSRRRREAIDGIPGTDELVPPVETEALPMASSAAEAAGVAPSSNGSGRTNATAPASDGSQRADA